MSAWVSIARAREAVPRDRQPRARTIRAVRRAELPAAGVPGREGATRRTAGNLWRAAALGVLTSAPLSTGAADDLELGEYLAAECTSCHDPAAAGRGIPNIIGMPRVVFVQAMEQYRSGARFNEIMRNVARSLGDEEVAALAAYLEQAPASR